MSIGNGFSIRIVNRWEKRSVLLELSPQQTHIKINTSTHTDRTPFVNLALASVEQFRWVSSCQLKAVSERVWERDSDVKRARTHRFNNHKSSSMYFEMEIYARPHVNQIESHFSTDSHWMFVRFVMRSIVSRRTSTSHMCNQSETHASKNNVYKALFSHSPSPSLFSLKIGKKEEKKHKPKRTNENKYLLHSFKHVFSFVTVAFFVSVPISIVVVFMLKNRISFDNVTHWIPTRCEKMWQELSRSSEWIFNIENKFSQRTNK